MPPKDQAASQKAYRLRQELKAGRTLMPIDALWLADYEERHPKAPPRNGPKTQSYGASASGRKISLDIEEHASAVGTGSAAVEAASAALAAKEEGRRLDSLTVNAVGALKEAVETYRAICLSMASRLETLEGTHIAMLEAVRGEMLARTDVEVAMREQAKTGDEDDMKGVLLALVAQKLGIDVPGMNGGGGTTKRKPAA